MTNNVKGVSIPWHHHVTGVLLVVNAVSDFHAVVFTHIHCSELITLRPGQNCRHFADDIFKCIFLNENIWILLKISLKFIPKVLINDTTALVQIMAWRRPGDKPLSELMMFSLPAYVCVTRPQWVKINLPVPRGNVYNMIKFPSNWPMNTRVVSRKLITDVVTPCT